MSIDQLEDSLINNKIKYIKNQSLAEYASFKIGGPAAFFCIPENVHQLKKAIESAKNANTPYFILGNGTNVLFKDSGYNGLVIHICKAFSEIHIQDNILTAGAGLGLKHACLAAANAGLSGLEFAYGIPGSVGGAIYMNAGAYGGEICHILKSVHILDEKGEEHDIPAKDLNLGYRTSIFHSKPWCVLSASFLLQNKSIDEIKAEMNDYMSRRRDKQPLNYPSAGSTFKRPQGAYAGQLIESCGLCGHSVGGAAISQKHCGFIVNTGGATCQNVMDLAKQVSETVKNNTGYCLEMEIKIIEEK